MNEALVVKNELDFSEYSKEACIKACLFVIQGFAYEMNSVQLELAIHVIKKRIPTGFNEDQWEEITNKLLKASLVESKKNLVNNM